MVKAWETTTLSAGFQPIGRRILREAPPLANVCPYWNRCAGGQKIQSYMRVYTLTCISSNGKAKHLSAPKCTVKSHQKLYRITGWKHGNVETEWKHVMKLAYFTTHLRFFFGNLSFAIFCYSFSRKTFSSPMNSEKTITDLELGLWYILEGLLRAKTSLQNMNLPQITSPNLQADLATHEKSSILNPCAVDVVGDPRVENCWSGWVLERCVVPTKNTLIHWNTQGAFIY